MDLSAEYTNRLIHSNSPYLKQHAHNPVDWYPWGDEAFEKARLEDKPIFLSIGYSTCHWCHVMAHESFEDEEVAKLLNDSFVCIKVDREERPDIDQLYMSAATTLIGRGGWPLTIVMGADKKPFFAGTYFPKNSAPGRVGLMELLPRIQQAWQDQRSELTQAAEQIIDALNRQQPEAGGGELDSGVIDLAAQAFKTQYDTLQGGFGSAPKFPSPHNLIFLLREGHRQEDEELVGMALNTLRQMRLGGLFDQIGYGFHRYSTDAQWHVPHFEKMLYDQAMLMLAYTEAWEVKQNPLFKQTVFEIFAYLEDKLQSEKGAFYSAEDADSEGSEGKFYIWTYGEVESILGAENTSRIATQFQLAPQGNFDDEATRMPAGENIFHLADQITYQTLIEDPNWLKMRERLYEHRELRVKPGLDDKILTDWNGLMLSALSRAARVFESEPLTQAARSLANYLLSEMVDTENQLIHVRSGDSKTVTAFVDDYSFVIQGLRNYYELSFEPEFLTHALRLQEEQLKRFWDTDQGGFFFTQAGEDELFLRQKEIYDGAIPSGNSVAMENLYYLGRLSENQEWEGLSRQIGSVFAEQVQRVPRGFAALLQGLQPQLFGSREVIIAGDEQEAKMARSILGKRYDPFTILLFNPIEEEALIRRMAPFLEYQKAIDNALTVYICENYACQTPLKGLDELRSSIVE